MTIYRPTTHVVRVGDAAGIMHTPAFSNQIATNAPVVSKKENNVDRLQRKRRMPCMRGANSAKVEDCRSAYTRTKRHGARMVVQLIGIRVKLVSTITKLAVDL